VDLVLVEPLRQPRRMSLPPVAIEVVDHDLDHHQLVAAIRDACRILPAFSARAGSLLDSAAESTAGAASSHRRTNRTTSAQAPC
jgi:hypothetical protein